MVLALEVIVLAIAVTLLVQRSAGSDISPSPSIFTIIPPIEGLPTIPIDLIPPSPASLPNVSYIPPLLTPVNSAPPPSLPNAPPPLPDPEIAPPPLPNSPNNQDPINNSPQPVPVAPVSVTSPPPSSSPPEPPSANPVVPLAPISVITSPPPSSSLQVPPSVNPVVPPAPISVSTPPPSISLPEPPSVNPVTPIAPVSVATPPPSISPPEPPSFNPVVPRLEPPSSIPNIAPTNKAPPLKPHAPEPVISTISPPPPSPSTKIDGTPVASPPNRKFPPISPENSPPSKAPPIQKRNASSPHNNIAPLSPPDIRAQAPSSLPSKLPPRHHYGNKNITTPPPSSLLSPPPSLSLPPPPSERGAFSPKPHRNNSQKGHASPPSPSPLSNNDNLPGSSPPLAPPPGQTTLPIISPKASPSGPSPSHTKPPLVPPIHALPPPPPNQECSPLTCTAPYTNTPPGPPCGCVWPMQVEIRLGVTLYTFFPLVSELAQEISLGVFMRQSQVRIMGANSASQDPEKTIVLIDLVPLGEKFDNTTAFLTAERFWNKRVVIKSELFGNYEVLYVRYPGLPPSPPSSINVMDGESYPGHGDNTRSVKPLGVDVSGVRHKRNSLSGSVVAIVVMSASVLLILIISVYWVLISKKRHGQQESTPPPPPLATLPFLSKPSGIAGANLGSIPSSETLSIKSCMVPYTGSAKTFSSSEINKATDNFDVTKIIGEGGFGRVYSGVLEDGTEVAVKVLKRDDQQGGREFLAEVEMLGRLHHRNLVKLIGICTEDRARCLVYELVRNGSVESHLHGVDKEIAPLDWGSRLKIALGAARGLAYLHEDSSPRVIHRDFKSSNILLEDDFTPKVSDFGLARTALDEENKHVSTRVMGTFGYVAPEYAMTGHLLVKSDVYSYGVVLLELLTGKKPIDMSQPPGRENLVSWARPLLTNQQDLQTILDPSLGPTFPFDSIAKVSAIASMCVQPEVSHRPFMGEVVQALKLVSDECIDTGSRVSNYEEEEVEEEVNVDLMDTCSPVSNYECGLDVESGYLGSGSRSDMFRFKRLEKQHSDSFRRHSSSGPLGKLRRFSRGAVSEHATSVRFWSGSH